MAEPEILAIQTEIEPPTIGIQVAIVDPLPVVVGIQD